MVEILGSQLCMESLQTDIADVQWTVNDVSSRLGPLDVSSWKFPDKKAWEVDVDHLLDMYSFSSDETEENQVAHIALYELLIDRLVLLAQGTGLYLGTLTTFGKGKGGRADGNPPHPPPPTSVGLAVKHFWSQLTNLQSLTEQLFSQNKASTKKVAELEKSLKKASSDIKVGSTLSVNSVVPDSSRGYSPPREISHDESSKSSQTHETAFVPCEGCEVVQRRMREAGDQLIDICHHQGLPSSLRKYRPQVSHVKWLSYNDVSRWMSEQNKDVTRLTKHIETMAATIDPLKAEVTAFQKETKKAESKARQCETDLIQEKETQAAVKKMYQVKLEEKEKQHEVTLADLHRQKEELQRKHTTLATELDQQKARSTELDGKLQHWDLPTGMVLCAESRGQQLEGELEERKGEVAKLQGVEAEAVSLRTELTDARSKLDTATRTLVKEHSKNKSAAQHQQQVQAKQESLSERVQELGQENEELRDTVNDLEEEKAELQDTLQETKLLTKELEKEKREQEIIIRNLGEAKMTLERSISETERQIGELEKSLTEAKERERLIIEYPDLNGPVNPDLTGTGDIALDMENQVKANVLRIDVLEDQNEALKRSIGKVVSLGRGGGGVHNKPTAPVPLWQTDSADVLNYRQPPPYQHPPPPPASPSSFPAAPQSGKPPHTDNNNHHHHHHPPRTLGSRPTSAHRKNSDVPPPASSEFFTVGRAPPPLPPDSKQQQQRPTSGKGGGHGGGRGGVAFQPVNSTSIGAYRQIKKSQGGGETRADDRGSAKGRRPPFLVCDPGLEGRRPPSAPSSRQQAGGGTWEGAGEGGVMETFVCEHCDKMYSKARDLEIHRSYCTA